jgi:uncharacterized membrane protein
MQSSPHATETSLVKLLKATAIGGLLFLLPLIVVAMLLGHAVHLAATITQPISSLLTLDRVVGPQGERLLAIAALVAITIAAGFLARTKLGKYVGRGFERSFLVSLPMYQMAKSMAEGFSRVEGAESVNPVLVSLEDGWQIGYLLETLHNGWVAVFVPQAPTPMSGNLMYLPAARVRSVQMTMPEAMMLIKRMGIGSATVLASTDLEQPRGPTAP